MTSYAQGDISLVWTKPPFRCYAKFRGKSYMGLQYPTPVCILACMPASFCRYGVCNRVQLIRSLQVFKITTSKYALSSVQLPFGTSPVDNSVTSENYNPKWPRISHKLQDHNRMCCLRSHGSIMVTRYLMRYGSDAMYSYSCNRSCIGTVPFFPLQSSPPC